MTKIRKQCPLLSKITFCTKFKRNVEWINTFALASYCDVGKFCYTIYIELFIQSNEALQSDIIDE